MSSKKKNSFKFESSSESDEESIIKIKNTKKENIKNKKDNKQPMKFKFIVSSEEDNSEKSNNENINKKIELKTKIEKPKEKSKAIKTKTFKFVDSSDEENSDNDNEKNNIKEKYKSVKINKNKNKKEISSTLSDNKNIKEINDKLNEIENIKKSVILLSKNIENIIINIEKINNIVANNDELEKKQYKKLKEYKEHKKHINNLIYNLDGNGCIIIGTDIDNDKINDVMGNIDYILNVDNSKDLFDEPIIEKINRSKKRKNKNNEKKEDE